MRRSLAASLLCTGLLVGCVRNPVGPGPSSPGLNNSTTYNGVVEQASPNVLFAPTNASQINTNAPTFGGAIEYSWGGASTTITQASAPLAVSGNGPSGSVWLLTGGELISPGVYAQNGIGGPLGNFGPNDYYIRWAGHKGPDPNLDYSSMTMYLGGVQVNYDLTDPNNGVHTPYQGFIFYARGHGNFEVTLSGNNLGDPYSTYNFYSFNFGPSLTGDNQWHEFTVQFSDMIQTYGQAADIKEVLKKCYGLQFDQLAPLTPDFQLDVEYVRFF